MSALCGLDGQGTHSRGPLHILRLPWGGRHPVSAADSAEGASGATLDCAIGLTPVTHQRRSGKRSDHQQVFRPAYGDSFEPHNLAGLEYYHSLPPGSLPTSPQNGKRLLNDKAPPGTHGSRKNQAGVRMLKSCNMPGVSASIDPPNSSLFDPREPRRVLRIDKHGHPHIQRVGSCSKALQSSAYAMLCTYVCMDDAVKMRMLQMRCAY